MATLDIDDKLGSLAASGGEMILLDLEDVALAQEHTWRVERYSDRKPGVYSDIKINGKFTKISLGKFLLGAEENQRVFRDPSAEDLDYRKRNLFLGKASDVKRKTGKPRREATSRYKGVHLIKCGWRATLSLNGKTLHLGVFATETEAALAYDKEVRKAFGTEAFVNFPDL